MSRGLSNDIKALLAKPIQSGVKHEAFSYCQLLLNNDTHWADFYIAASDFIIYSSNNNNVVNQSKLTSEQYITFRIFNTDFTDYSSLKKLDIYGSNSGIKADIKIRCGSQYDYYDIEITDYEFQKNFDDYILDEDLVPATVWADFWYIEVKIKFYGFGILYWIKLYFQTDYSFNTDDVLDFSEVNEELKNNIYQNNSNMKLVLGNGPGPGKLFGKYLSTSVFVNIDFLVPDSTGAYQRVNVFCGKVIRMEYAAKDNLYYLTFYNRFNEFKDYQYDLESFLTENRYNVLYPFMHDFEHIGKKTGLKLSDNRTDKISLPQTGINVFDTGFYKDDYSFHNEISVNRGGNIVRAIYQTDDVNPVKFCIGENDIEEDGERIGTFLTPDHHLGSTVGLHKIYNNVIYGYREGLSGALTMFCYDSIRAVDGQPDFKSERSVEFSSPDTAVEILDMLLTEEYTDNDFHNTIYVFYATGKRTAGNYKMRLAKWITEGDDVGTFTQIWDYDLRVANFEPYLHEELSEFWIRELKLFYFKEREMLFLWATSEWSRLYLSYVLNDPGPPAVYDAHFFWSRTGGLDLMVYDIDADLVLKQFAFYNSEPEESGEDYYYPADYKAALIYCYGDVQASTVDGGYSGSSSILTDADLLSYSPKIRGLNFKITGYDDDLYYFRGFVAYSTDESDWNVFAFDGSYEPGLEDSVLIEITTGQSILDYANAFIALLHQYDFTTTITDDPIFIYFCDLSGSNMTTLKFKEYGEDVATKHTFDSLPKKSAFLKTDDNKKIYFMDGNKDIICYENGVNRVFDFVETGRLAEEDADYDDLTYLDVINAIMPMFNLSLFMAGDQVSITGIQDKYLCSKKAVSQVFEYDQTVEIDEEYRNKLTLMYDYDFDTDAYLESESEQNDADILAYGLKDEEIGVKNLKNPSLAAYVLGQLFEDMNKKVKSKLETHFDLDLVAGDQLFYDYWKQIIGIKYDLKKRVINLTTKDITSDDADLHSRYGLAKFGSCKYG